MDEAGAAVHIERSFGNHMNGANNSDPPPPIVTENDVADIISQWTGIPIGKIDAAETSNLLTLESSMTKRVKGQDRAVRSIARAVRRARSGLRDQSRPVASFLFCGSTGVGKTWLAKTLAATYYGSEKDMVRIDMSEYMEKHTASRLTGPPPGYVGYEEGGQLTEAVRRSPHSVVLLDEIEKAHRDVLNVLLQVMEDGVLTDGKGRTVCFKNVILVMTSNVGSMRILDLVDEQRMARLIDAGANGGNGQVVRRKKKKRRAEGGPSFEDSVFGDDDEEEPSPNAVSLERAAAEYAALSAVVQEELKAEMKPELLNRIDEIITFSPLGGADLRDIARAIVNESIDRAQKERDVHVRITESLLDAVLADGGEASAARFGARPMRRAVRRLFEDAVSDAIVRGFLGEGDVGVVDMGLSGGYVGTLPTVVVTREKDGATLVVEVDDGSGGIGAAVSTAIEVPPLSTGFMPNGSGMTEREVLETEVMKTDVV